VYLTPLLGGYLSDRFWGNRKSILIGGILMALGQFAMFFSGSSVTEGLQNNTSVTAMWVGLTLLLLEMVFLSQIFQQWLVNCIQKATIELMEHLPFFTWV